MKGRRDGLQAWPIGATMAVTWLAAALFLALACLAILLGFGYAGH